ncbi:MAG: hypothetical protein WAX04_07640 [Oscillospiraceae bacterium]
MLISGFCNIASLLLGLVAWTVPFIVIHQNNQGAVIRQPLFSVISFGACAVSLCLQLFEINHRVEIRDWSALMDTCGTIAIVAAVLTVITIILNVYVLTKCHNNEIKSQ